MGYAFRPFLRADEYHFIFYQNCPQLTLKVKFTHWFGIVKFLKLLRIKVLRIFFVLYVFPFYIALL